MIDFKQLAVDGEYRLAWQTLFEHGYGLDVASFAQRDWLDDMRQRWRDIVAVNADDDWALSEWLIAAFRHLFVHHHTILVRGGDEPEYFPAYDTQGVWQPARIVFAHGYFASCLHEISHWCIAGKKRRKLQDFGYWYAQDGRNQSQQHAFEQVEIKPQALECLFALACRRYFYVSQDNLNADFDTSGSTFAQDVYHQAYQYLHCPQTLPSDAKVLLTFFLMMAWDFTLPL